MKPKQQRMILVALAVAALGGATALAMSALGDNLSYFRDPTDVKSGIVQVGDTFRLGGLVKPGSVQKSSDGVTLRFVITDTKNDLAVEYRGLTPDLFREGSGAVAEGALKAGGIFVATKVLAKHDENYMPPEVAASLKERGEWRPEASAGTSAVGATQK